MQWNRQRFRQTGSARSHQAEKEVIVMQKLSDYIQELKNKIKTEENQDLSRPLQVDEQSGSRWVSGEEIPDDGTCVELAYIAKEDPAKIIILKHLSSAAGDSREFWEKISIKYRYGRTVTKPWEEGSRYDRRHSSVQ